MLCLWCACTPRAAAQTPAEQTLAPATVTASLAKETLTGDAAYQKIETAALRRRGITDTGDALRRMADREAVYAYTFSGRSYDTGNKLGFLKATVEYALRREDLGDAFREYLRTSLP